MRAAFDELPLGTKFRSHRREGTFVKIAMSMGKRCPTCGHVEVAMRAEDVETHQVFAHLNEEVEVVEYAKRSVGANTAPRS